MPTIAEAPVGRPTLPESKPLIPALDRALSGLEPYTYPLTRFACGAIFVPHGAQKLFEWFGGSIAGSTKFFAKYGFEPALTMVYLAGSIEFFVGIALAIGLFTRLSAFILAVFLAVTIIGVSWQAGFFWTRGGYEYALLWMVVCLVCVVHGPGRYAVDNLLPRRI